MDLLLCPISCYFSVAKLYPTLWDLKYCRITCFPVLHHLLEFAPIYVHWVSDATELCHSLPFPFPPAFYLSQHQAVFQWVSFLHQMAKLSELQPQHQSFQWTIRINFLQNWQIWSPCSARDSQESSPAPQFKSINSLVLNLLYSATPTFVL